MAQGFSDVILEAYGITDNINEIKQPSSSVCVRNFYPLINFVINLKNKIAKKLEK